MALRASLLFLLLAVASMAALAASPATDSGLMPFRAGGGNNHYLGALACDGLIGDCVEEEEEMSMETEINRRTLREATKYISYRALLKNSVPCNKRGASYYNCRSRGRVNPYRRGCSIITRCARILR